MIYLSLGLYVLKLDSKSRSNRAFFGLTVSLSIWALAYTFVYPAPDKSTAFLWIYIASLGVYYMPGFLIQFILHLTTPFHKIHKWWIYVLTFLPGALVHFHSATVSHVTVSDIGLGKYGWFEVVDLHSPWFWILNLYFLLYLGIGAILMISWGRKSMRMRQRKQSRLIANSLILTIVASYLTDSVFPAMSSINFPSIAPVFFLIMAVGMWMSIQKYRLMTLTPEIAADEIISKISELIFLVNSQGQIILSNEKAQAVLGYTSMELRGTFIASFLNMQSFNNSLVKDGNFILTENFITDVEFVRKNGDVIPIEMSCSPIKDRAQEVIGLVIVGQDLRMLHQLQALEKEREYHDLKTRFITTASHEFRTPLSTILLSAETLQNRYELMDDEKKNDYFTRIYRSVDRMKNLLGDVLTLEKMSSQAVQASYQEINLEQFFKEVIDEHMVQLENIHHIDLQISRNTPENIESDPKLLRNIISNLLTNARKYSDENKPIQIKVNTIQNNIRITIKDEGIGIPPDDRDYIFNSFHRGKNIGNISGTGLGLAIVKNSVDLLKGSIQVESRESQGSTFKVVIPFSGS